jgi:gephyrin
MSQEIHKASPYPMLPVPDALHITLSHTRVMSSQLVDIQHALGRVLAQDVHAADPLPPFPASIKDGYAVVAEVRSHHCAGHRIAHE